MTAEISSGVVQDAVLGLGSESRLCSTSMVRTRTMFTVTPVPATSRASPPRCLLRCLADGVRRDRLARVRRERRGNGHDPAPAGGGHPGTMVRTMFSVVHRCWLSMAPTSASRTLTTDSPPW